MRPTLRARIFARHQTFVNAEKEPAMKPALFCGRRKNERTDCELCMRQMVEGQRESISIFTIEDTKQGHGNNLQIEGEAPVPQVIEIVLDTLGD